MRCVLGMVAVRLPLRIIGACGSIFPIMSPLRICPRMLHVPCPTPVVFASRLPTARRRGQRPSSRFRTAPPSRLIPETRKQPRDNLQSPRATLVPSKDAPSRRRHRTKQDSGGRVLCDGFSLCLSATTWRPVHFACRPHSDENRVFSHMMLAHNIYGHHSMLHAKR